jgi:hypothetical protein
VPAALFTANKDFSRFFKGQPQGVIEIEFISLLKYLVFLLNI